MSAGHPFLQAVIWGGALFVGALTFVALNRRFTIGKLPLEVQLLTLFWLWSLLGIVFVVDLDAFVRYSRQILQFILIVSLLSFIIGQAGSVKPIYFAFVVVGGGLPVLRTLGLETGFTIESLQSVDRVEEANALGFQSVLGLIGVLGLLPETRSWLLRSALVTASLFAVYGVVLSGSRGAFVTFFLVLVIWPLFCFRNLFRFGWTAAVFVLILAALGYGLYEFVLQNSNLGRRFQDLQGFEDRSTQTRWHLFLMGFKLAYDSGGIGSGLGQFGIASETGLYAHNEFAELLGTTGIVGVVLYYLAYLQSWKRLQRAATLHDEQTVLYRINFAKLMLVVLVFSGMLFRPNFLQQDTMFLYALIVGVSLWALHFRRKSRM